MKWFYIDESITDGDRRQGPFTSDEINELVHSGKITETTLVWHTGEEKWKSWKETEESKIILSRDELLQSTLEALYKEQIQSRQFAGFISRACAYIVDNLLLGILGGATLFALGIAGYIDLEAIQNAAGAYLASPTSKDAFNQLTEAPGMGTFLTVWSILQAVYFIVLHALFSATLGKKLFHIHVETATGEKLGWASSTARYLCSILTQFTMVFYGLGYLIVCVDPKRRALHDWIAKTFVVHDNKEN